MRAARATPALSLAFAALALASVLALASLRAIATPPLVEVPIAPAAVHVAGGLVQGTVREGLPPFELHWDGQPPSAVLVDASSGITLAAAALSDRTFEENRSAVRFIGGQARFKLDARRWADGSSLALRVEAVGSRVWFFVWGILSGVLAIGLLILFALRRARARGRDAGLHLTGSLIFVAVACGTFSSIYPAAPIRIGNGADEAAINSYAAAYDHPERFTRDTLLSDASNFRWYTPVYVQTIRGFGHLGFHYQTACAFLGAAAALLFLFGLRRLLMDVSGRADFALAATLALGLLYSDALPPYGELWAIIWVLPRTVFAAFVPWVLVLALRYAPSSRQWWIPCGAAGLLAYVYPLSAPALVGALLLALIAASDEPLPARVRGTLRAILSIAATMLPYGVIYVLHVRAAPDVDPATSRRALDIVRGSFDYVRIGSMLRLVPIYRVTTFRILLDAFAAILVMRRRFDSCVRFYVGFLAGFLLVTFGIPVADSAIAAWLGRRQFEYDLVRNARYLDFLVIGAIAVGVGGWRGSRRQAVVAACVGTLCAAVAFGPGWSDTAYFVATRTHHDWRVIDGHPDRDTEAAQEAIRAVQALRAAPERVSGPIDLRQYGIPIAWVPKDILALSYSVSRTLVVANDAYRRAEPLLARPLTAGSLQEASSILGAQLFLVHPAQLDPALAASASLLFRNDEWAIVRVAMRALRATPGLPGDTVDRSTAHGIAGASAPAA